MAFEVFKQTIKDKFTGVLMASVLLFVYIFLIATFYPQVSSMGDMYSQMLQNPTFKAFLGDEVYALATFGGFMGIEAFSYMGIVVGAYVIFLTASFASGEIEQKTSEMLLSLPVSRVTIILSRFLALIPLVALVMLGMVAGIYAGSVYIGEDIQIQWFALAMVFMGVFMLAAGAISLLISALMSDGRRAAMLSIGILLAMYLVENIGTMVTSIDWARRLTLFHYMKLNAIAVAHTVNWNNMAVLLAVTVVFLALAAVAFQRRDINVT